MAEKLTKEELIQAAKEIREICRRHDYYCTDCPFVYCNDEGAVNCCPFDGTPEDWEIERLERESNENR